MIQTHMALYVTNMQSRHKDGIRTNLIPKPPGQAGCISRGGYSLEQHLNWELTLYVSIQVSFIIEDSFQI